MTKSYFVFFRISILLFLFVVIFNFTLPVKAATFQFNPANSQFVEGCKVSVGIDIIATGEKSNAADIELYYNPSEIEIIDSNSSQPGIQIKTGNAYESYFANEVDTSSGRIRLAGASFMNNLTSKKQFATIEFKAKSGVKKTNFNIKFEGVGNTLDSNIADNETSLDLLKSVTNGQYTFTTGFCQADKQPPQITFLSPTNYSTGIKANSEVKIRMTDNQSGINLETVQFDINGEIYKPTDQEVSFTGTQLDYEFIIKPRIPLNENAENYTSVVATDNSGNQGRKKIIFNIPKEVCEFPQPDVQPLPDPNTEDNDIDNDFIPDSSDPDVDGDGINNIFDKDIDGDGIDNNNDNDIDGDGIENSLDSSPEGVGSQDDIDNDGINNDRDSDVDGDGFSNSEDSDIDGDGIINYSDSDIDGDGINNDKDTDKDGDGVLDSEDEEPNGKGNQDDLDGDGLGNSEDSDVNGDFQNNIFDEDIDKDGTNNDLDQDRDGDGQENNQDQTPNGKGTLGDIDGDQLENSEDPDIDGDGIVNYSDPDIDGDGIFNDFDSDRDQDNILNENDSTPNGIGNINDLDGDGIPNSTDKDIDGDGVENDQDENPSGDNYLNNQTVTSLDNQNLERLCGNYNALLSSQEFENDKSLPSWTRNLFGPINNWQFFGLEYGFNLRIFRLFALLNLIILLLNLSIRYFKREIIDIQNEIERRATVFSPGFMFAGISFSIFCMLMALSVLNLLITIGYISFYVLKTARKKLTDDKQPPEPFTSLTYPKKLNSDSLPNHQIPEDYN